MAVKSLKPYIGVPRDTVGNFFGKQIVYACWDHHLLFAAGVMMCVEPEMRFADLVNGPMTALFKPDPDSDKLDWKKVEWLKSNKPFTPDFDKSLAANGIVHKDQLRFHTPGLNSLCGGTA